MSGRLLALYAENRMRTPHAVGTFANVSQRGIRCPASTRDSAMRSMFALRAIFDAPTSASAKRLHAQARVVAHLLDRRGEV